MAGLWPTVLRALKLLVLSAWLLGALGVFGQGNSVHVVLLLGLMLLGFLRARDAAVQRATDDSSKVR